MQMFLWGFLAGIITTLTGLVLASLALRTRCTIAERRDLPVEQGRPARPAPDPRDRRPRVIRLG